MRKISCFIMLLLLTSCTTNYYTMYMAQDTEIRANSSVGSQATAIIPAGTPVFIAVGNSTYSKVKWGAHKGWVPISSYTITQKTPLVLSTDSNVINTRSTPQYTPSSSSSSGGSVQVKGYYRKNGTYVKPHTRSAPRRR